MSLIPRPAPFAHPAAPRLAGGLLVLALAVGLAGGARADVAHPDEEFLTSHFAEIDEIAPTWRVTAGDPEGAFRSMVLLLEYRAKALNELNERTPLTQFDGIETQDRFEDRLVRELNGILQAGLGDAPDPDEEDALYFAAVMGDPPPLGAAPVPFMALDHAQIAVATVSALDGDPALDGATARLLADRFAAQSASYYLEKRKDPLAASASDNFRQGAVVVRMRCPKDGSNYRVAEQKRQIRNEVEIYTVLTLKCNVCYEPLTLDFPMEHVSRLNRIAERQGLKGKPTGVRPTPGLDP